MNLLLALLDSLAAFVRRNPLTVLLIAVLAVTAPALLRGLATFILYLVLGFVLLVCILTLALRHRLRTMQRRMEEQFGARPDAESSYRWTNRRNVRPDEGDVRVHRTAATPGKRISDEVGDYVDFEETRES